MALKLILLGRYAHHDRRRWTGLEWGRISICCRVRCVGGSYARVGRRRPDRVAPRPRGHDAGARDLLDVALVGPAAAPENRQLRKPGDQRGVLGAEGHGVAGVELGRHVELGMALARGVCADPAQATEPRPTVL